MKALKKKIISLPKCSRLPPALAVFPDVVVFLNVSTASKKIGFKRLDIQIIPINSMVKICVQPAF